jgi:hypothetical protein
MLNAKGMDKALFSEVSESSHSPLVLIGEPTQGYPHHPLDPHKDQVLFSGYLSPHQNDGSPQSPTRPRLRERQ